MAGALDQAAQVWNPKTRKVGDGELVAEQMKTLLGSDSGYLKSARQSGVDYAHQRQLLNSSLAAGASEKAAIDAVLPIAQQDAQTNFQQGIANQDISNTALRDTGQLHGQTAANSKLMKDQASFDSLNELSRQRAGIFAQYVQAAAQINSSDRRANEKSAQLSALHNQMLDQIETLTEFNRTAYEGSDAYGQVRSESRQAATKRFTNFLDFSNFNF